MDHQFAYTEEQLAEVAHDLIAQAHAAGASDVKVSLSEMAGLSVEVMDGRVNTRSQHAKSGLSLTVFRGDRQGTTHSTDFSAVNLQRMVGKALDIARYTNEDRHAGLVDGDGLSRFYADLKLDNPWDLSIEEALEHAHRVEAGIRAVGRDVRSDGASLSTSRSQFQLVTSRGFCRTATRTDHNISARVIANRDGQNKPDAWTDYQVAPHRLQAPEATGERAARSALEALGGCSISSRSCPVLFAPKAAHSLTQHFFQAVNGGELSRGSSFLRGSLGQVIFAEHIDVLEDPFLVGGAASACFDTDGVVGQRRAVVKHGMVSGYFLNAYSARRLGMVSTGNAQGAHNLTLKSRLTRPEDDLPAMLCKLHTGLLVTHLMGDGVRLASGDYSRAAQGFWVENGQIQFPVEQITIAGHLREIFAGIVAVGSDTLTLGNISSGSVLIDQLRIGGQ
ncbi:TldD/PmbA family protein [Pseudomonas asplenii]|uniref:TldD/PmbA family protein n=1 Tax=Pseudomonas asplenii TaxID=53407 RepID=UPI0037CC9F89